MNEVEGLRAHTPNAPIARSVQLGADPALQPKSFETPIGVPPGFAEYVFASRPRPQNIWDHPDDVPQKRRRGEPPTALLEGVIVAPSAASRAPAKPQQADVVVDAAPPTQTVDDSGQAESPIDVRHRRSSSKTESLERLSKRAIELRGGSTSTQRPACSSQPEEPGSDDAQIESLSRLTQRAIDLRGGSTSEQRHPSLSEEHKQPLPPEQTLHKVPVPAPLPERHFNAFDHREVERKSPGAATWSRMGKVQACSVSRARVR
eukprot:5735316-Prymnesium_polylepis.1